MQKINAFKAIIKLKAKPYLIAAASALLAGQAGLAQADDYKWPRMLVIGTPGTQTASFASTNGWAPILQKSGGPVVRVIPENSEAMRYQRLTIRQDMQMSSVSAAEVRSQIQGIDGYAAIKAAPQHIIWHHNDTPWGLVVAGDSDLKTMDDLKNKDDLTISKGIFSPNMVRAVTEGIPSFAGLTPEQTKNIQYRSASSYSENCRAVVEGKADVAWCAPVSSVLSEMEGAPGSIRWISMDIDDKEAWARYLEHRSMAIPATIETGVATARGVGGVVSNFLYTAPAETDADFAYHMAKWFNESYDKYKGTHPTSTRMSLEIFRSYLDRSPLPVHEGTVKYLREVGAWSDEDNARNQAAIEQMDRWVAARNAALKEAREKKVTISFENQAYMDILNQHTKGLEDFKTRL